MKILIMFFSLLFISNIQAQTYRDSLTSQIIYNFPKDDVAYQKLKSDIKSLEKLEEKPNPEILHTKLSDIFKFNDTDYFKEVLTLLTRKYGYNLSYASGYENYYDAIIKGDLAVWFKEMYIKDHSEWLSENLEKQIDIYRLNSLYDKDQIQRGFFSMIRNVKDLTDNQLKEIRTLEGEVFTNNFENLIDISNKVKNLPKGNSFALIQNGYGIVELHIMQHEDTFDKAWQKMYPLYRKAYINKDISSKYFRDIDSHMYRFNGKQMFNLLKIENFHETQKNNPNDKEIPLANPEQTKKLRQELGWE